MQEVRVERTTLTYLDVFRMEQHVSPTQDTLILVSYWFWVFLFHSLFYQVFWLISVHHYSCSDTLILEMIAMSVFVMYLLGDMDCDGVFDMTRLDRTYIIWALGPRGNTALQHSERSGGEQTHLLLSKSFKRRHRYWCVITPTVNAALPWMQDYCCDDFYSFT